MLHRISTLVICVQLELDSWRGWLKNLCTLCLLVVSPCKVKQYNCFFSLQIYSARWHQMPVRFINNLQWKCLFLQLSDNHSYKSVLMSLARKILRGSRLVASVLLMWILESRSWLSLTMHLINIFLSWFPHDMCWSSELASWSTTLALWAGSEFSGIAKY